MDITITKEIKPCPFCGGIGEIHNEGDWGSIWVQCRECSAEGSWIDTHDGYNENDAIDRWNNRVDTEIMIELLKRFSNAYVDVLPICGELDDEDDKEHIELHKIAMDILNGRIKL